MKRLSMVAFAMSVASTAVPAKANDLAAQIVKSDGWVAWNVPMIADAGVPCCYVHRNNDLVDATCELDQRDGSFGTDSRSARSDSTLSVYAHIEHGRVDRVRGLGSSCPVNSTTPIRMVDAVEPAQSVKILSDWIDRPDRGRSDDDMALAALAYHQEASATRALAMLAGPAHAREPRKQALFWLGQARGADGADIVERFATTDADPDMREHAIFVLTQSHGADPYARIVAISHSDPVGHVRSQALFWMAQTQDARAAADITAALTSESSADVREQAVFALSQLKEGRAENALIAVLRGSYPREVKKQALFWLGQSGSPRALKALDDVLAKASPAGKAGVD